MILNGAPRSGKSSIVRAIQASPGRPWMNLGVDAYVREIIPAQYRPDLGLRPGGERPDLEALVATSYLALYQSIAVHSRLGLNVVADVGHHDAYSRRLNILARCAGVLANFPVLFVGVRCPVDVIMRRRSRPDQERENDYLRGSESDPIPAPVLTWQQEVHSPGIYDLEVDTSVESPETCAAVILERLRRLESPFEAFAKLAAGKTIGRQLFASRSDWLGAVKGTLITASLRGGFHTCRLPIAGEVLCAIAGPISLRILFRQQWKPCTYSRRSWERFVWV